MIFISINTAVCKNFEPPTYMNIYWRDLLIWWGVIYPSANIVFFWHKNACRMMQLQACVNFSCLKTFCTKNEHIYIYLYISGGFKIFANIYIIYIYIYIYIYISYIIYLFKYIYICSWCATYRVLQKFATTFSSLKFHWLLKLPFVKLSMLFNIHLTLNNRNISNQNVFLYVFWHFLCGEV